MVFSDAIGLVEREIQVGRRCTCCQQSLQIVQFQPRQCLRKDLLRNFPKFMTHLFEETGCLITEEDKISYIYM